MAITPPSQFRRFRLRYLIECPGQKILTFILKCGTNTLTIPPSVLLHEYLNTLSDNSSANYVVSGQKKKMKSPFDASQMPQIENDPLWNSFDISLLYKAIRLACEDVASDSDEKWKDANGMEGLIKQIKDERNALIHEVQPVTEAKFWAKVHRLENLFKKTLDAAKTRYNVSDAEYTPVRNEVLRDIQKIKQMDMEKEISKEIWTARLPDFIKESQRHLKELYDQDQYFDPLSFLSDFPQDEIHIQSIFCAVSLVQKNQDITKKFVIDSRDILTLTEPMKQCPKPSLSSQTTHSTQGRKPQLVMIRGVAGSGKTTLLTFLLSEWLKNADDCSIKHLHNYDIVLRIMCREKDGPTLQDFLKQVLPNFFAVMEEFLVVLLKDCKVLFLIDGLDELPQDGLTNQLVTDILNIGKNVPGFTIICTSRPESVNYFLKSIPSRYQLWKMDMEGVNPEDRSDFVLRHYNTLPNDRNKDPGRLKYLMECFGWREHFGLPLNLLFVSTLFYTNPDCVKNNTSQTSLYLRIHEWCVQKLKTRLQVHSQEETNVERVLEVMYDVALQGLLEDRLSLSVVDTDRLKESCRTNGELPYLEVMGAFLCLRETIVRYVPHQKYSAPHKSIQEFFAAKCIVHKLVVESPCAGSMRRLLHNPSLEHLRKFRNLLLHVAGLLCQPDAPPLLKAIQEVVDLLAETQMEDCDDWLSFLEDTEVNRTALECVARHVKRDNNEMVPVTDSTVTSAKALLPLISPKEVRIILLRKVSNLHQLVGEHHIYRKVFLWHHYKQPLETAASDSLLHALPRDHLDEFMGHLSGSAIKLLSEYPLITLLYLAVSNDADAQTVPSAISAVSTSLPYLKNLNLHFPVSAASPDKIITQLPDGPLVTLVLSGVNETLLETTGLIAAALQPRKKGFWRIIFPDSSSMKANVWRRLLEELENAGVRVGGCVIVPDTIPITGEERTELRSIARTRGLGVLKSLPEDLLWSTLWPLPPSRYSY